MESQATFFQGSGWPGALERGRKSVELGMGKHSDFETNFADHLAALASASLSTQ